MNERCKKLITILNTQRNWLTGKELAGLLNVTDRTIRHDIDTINKEFNGLIESNCRFGYRINVNKAESIQLIDHQNIPQTSDDRIKYILNELLRTGQFVSGYALENALFVSDSTIKSDFRKLTKMLEEYSSLKLIHEDNRYRLEGNEEEKRLLYKRLLTKETQGDFINLQKIAILFTQFDLLYVKKVLDEVFNEYDFSIRDETYPMLMIHIGVALQRMMMFNYVQKFSSSNIKTVKEYLIAKTFYERMKKYLHLQEVNESESMLLASLLLGKRSADFRANRDVIEIAKELTIKIVVAINDHYDIDFSGDVFFQNGLIVHLQNLIDRVRHNVQLSNVFLAEVKKSYPLVFDLSVFIGHIIEEELNQPITEDELGFLTVHLGAAYDRLNMNTFFHAVLIQPNSSMMNSVCLTRLKEKFSDRLIIDALLGYYDQGRIDSLGPDFIITTVPFDALTTTPIINISMFVGSKDEFKIFKMLNDLEKERLKTTFDSFIRGLINQNCYFYNLEAESYEEVLNIMADNLYALNLVNSDFKASTFDREKRAFTSFAYGYAIPHALDYCAKQSCISIAILKKPVRWGDYDTKLVVMLAIKENEKSLLKIFFDWFGSISDDDGLMNRVISADNSQKFIECILDNE